jgi:5-methylcytosine-specific restriction endonuclease McrA
MSGKKYWRGVSAKVAKDKQDIYNSREWQELRIAKLRSTNGLCEECLKQGITNPARCVHHIVPIETARTKDEMKRLAIDCGLQGLKALCFACHARIHKELGSNTAKIVKARAEARQDRWADNLMSKFTIKQEDNGIQTEIYEGPVRETGANRTYGAQAQTNAEGSGNYQDKMG